VVAKFIKYNAIIFIAIIKSIGHKEREEKRRESLRKQQGLPGATLLTSVVH